MICDEKTELLANEEPATRNTFDEKAEAFKRERSSDFNYRERTLSAPLPDGWERKFSAKGRVYYVDHITHTTTVSRLCRSKSLLGSCERVSLTDHRKFRKKQRLTPDQIVDVSDHRSRDQDLARANHAHCFSSS
jgi:hypothetical protein